MTFASWIAWIPNASCPAIFQNSVVDTQAAVRIDGYDCFERIRLQRSEFAEFHHDVNMIE
jgi:hypothetical protein